MKRAEGTGSPEALTLIRVSRAGSSAVSRPPTAIETTQVPVETTAKGAARAFRCGKSEAFESWMPQTTGVPGARPVAATTSGVTGPRRSAALRTGGISGRQPSRSTSEEKVRAAGFHRSVWQPSEVASVAATPVRRKAQYCG